MAIVGIDKLSLLDYEDKVSVVLFSQACNMRCPFCHNGAAVLGASKEDEIKKAQMTFVKRLIAAVIVFFVVSLVQIVVRFVSGNDENSIMGCFNCFVNGSVSDNNSSSCQLRN